MFLKNANLRFRFPSLLAFAFSLIATPATQALDAGEMKEYLAKNLTNHLPITVIGPLIASDISVVSVDGGFSVSISGTQFFSGVPVGDFAFQMKELTENQYSVEETELPMAITSADGEIFPMSRHTLEGIWSLKDNTYLSVAYGVEGLSIDTGDQDMTFANFDLEIGQQNAEGVQEYSIDLGPVSINDTRDGDTMIFDGLKAEGMVTSGETLKPYKVLGDMVSKFMMDGTGILRSQSDVLDLMKPLYIAYDAATLSLDTGKLRIEEPEKKARYAVESITFNSEARDLLNGSEGHSDFDLVMKGIQLTTRENALAVGKLRVFAGSDKINGTHAFTFGNKYLELLEDEAEEIDMADAMDLYLNFNDFGMQVELENFSLATGNGTSIELEATSFGGQLQGLRSDQADLLLNIAHEEIKVSGLDEDLLQALVPEKSKIVLRLDDVPMTKVRDGIVGKKIPVSLIKGDDKALGEFMREIGFQMLGILLSQPPQIKIEDTSIDTATIKTKIDGSFDISPISEKMVAGHINVYASGFKDLQKVASKSLRSASGSTKKIALGLVGGLGIAQGFGKKQDDGSLLYKLTLDEAGIIKVNNLPLPKF